MPGHDNILLFDEDVHLPVTPKAWFSKRASILEFIFKGEGHQSTMFQLIQYTVHKSTFLY